MWQLWSLAKTECRHRLGSSLQRGSAVNRCGRGRRRTQEMIKEGNERSSMAARPRG